MKPKRKACVDFGWKRGDFNPCYVLSIERDARRDVVLSEDDGLSESTFERARLPRATWNALKEDATADLNAAMKKVGFAPARFRIGDTKLDRMLGQELTLLLQVASARPTAAKAAAANWMGLRPEERWWLRRKADSSPAWREAVANGLTEKPTS